MISVMAFIIFGGLGFWSGFWSGFKVGGDVGALPAQLKALREKRDELSEQTEERERWVNDHHAN